MTRLQQKPILHGRDHCPGGPDPIPCWPGGLAPGTFNEGVLAIDDLLGYWRLGETGTPWADTSGVAPTANMTEQESGAAVTPDVTGGLSPDQDDGAVELNYDGTTVGSGRHLRSPNTGGSKDFNLNHMTVCAWVNVKASALTRRGVVTGQVNIDGSGNRVGWGLEVVYPARTVRFARAALYAESAAVVADEWNFVVGTYDGTTISLYMNAALVDDTADSTNAAVGAGDLACWIGFGYAQYISFSAVPGYLYGTVDEVAVWTRALTQTEISELYASGVGAFQDGWILTMVGGVPTWQAPTIEVAY